MNKLHYYTILFLSIYLCSIAFAGEKTGVEVLTLKDNQKTYQLGHYLEIFPGSPKNLTIDDIVKNNYSKKFLPSYSAAPNFGFDELDYWARFRVKNAIGRDAEFFLELGYPHIDIFKIYVKGRDGRFKERVTGDRFRFSKREISYRDFVFPLHLKQGSVQDIYLYVAGKCSKDFKLKLYTPESFSEKIIEEKFILGIYYGIVIVMALYNLFLFFFVRSRTYLYYVIYIVCYALVQMAYNGLAFKYIWPGLPGWHNISLPFLIGITVVAMGVFSRRFLETWNNCPRIELIVRAIIAIAGLTAVTSIAASLTGYYLFAIQFAMILMVAASATFIAAGFICLRRGYRPARFYLIAWIAFLFGMVLIAMNKLSFIPSNFFTEYAIQVGSALEVTLLSIALADRINVMNEEKRQAELEQMKAQEKYKVLVESTNDIVFTMDESWNFTTMNKRGYMKLKIIPEELQSVNFLDLIYETGDELDVSKKLVSEKLEIFKEEKKPLNFKVEFRSSIKEEPFEMQIWLEYIIVEGRNEILGKAASVVEDTLIKYFEYEKQRFSIGNYLTTAEDISHRMTRNLQKYMGHREINFLRLALREMLINAIEHGNLEINYEDKTEALEDNSYFEIIAQRRHLPEYSDRQVQIVFSIDDEKVVYRITDEGKGFDHVNLMQSASESANEYMLSHGRGLILAQNIFDEVKYNSKGNQVLLVKHFNGLDK